MHIEFLVEEPSAEAALLNILPKVLQPITSFAIHPYQGKRDLLKKLPSRFRGYKTWLPKDWRIVVLIDTDDEDCRQLKAWLDDISHNSTLLTKSVTRNSSNFQFL